MSAAQRLPLHCLIPATLIAHNLNTLPKSRLQRAKYALPSMLSSAALSRVGIQYFQRSDEAIKLAPVEVDGRRWGQRAVL